MSRLLRGLVLSLYVVGLLLAGPAASASAAVRESILYQDGDGRFYRVDPDGSNTMQLLNSLGSAASFTRPTPDGLRLLSYLSLTSLSLSSTGGVGAVNIAPAGFNLATPYAFSPDGTQIAFPGRTGGATFSSVHKMNIDGSGPTQLVPTGARHQAVFDWGAGGILYKDWDGSTLTFPLWVVDPVTLSRTRLSPANYTLLDARWSPDGSKIAFVASERIGSTVQPYALYVKHAGGTYKVSTTPAIVPNSVSWAPSGDRVALTGYASGDSGHYKVFDVSLDLGANTGTATVIASSTTNGSTGAVWWGDLADPSIPTVISTVDVTGQYSETVTLEATLQESGGVPVTGAPVTFSVGGVVVGTATTNGSGLATLSYPITNGPGTYTISVSYAGDPIRAPSTTAPSGDKSLTVTKALVILSATDRTIDYGDPVTLTGTLRRATDGTPAAGESLQFTVGGTVVGSATTDASGLASFTYAPSLAGGNYPIAVTYAGSSLLQAGSAAATLTVTKAATTLTAADLTVTYGQSVTLSATLMAGASPVAGATVEFKVGTTYLGNGTTNASGVATYTYTPNLAGGAHTITATFVGDSFYYGASDTATLTVNKAATAVTVASATTDWGSPVTLSATLTTGGSPLAGRSLVFKVDGTNVGTATTNGVGVASLSYTPTAIPPGNHTITVDFGGDSFYLSSSGIGNMIVNQAPTTLTAADVTLTYGQAGALTATLMNGSTPVSGQPIQFQVNGTVVGTATTNAAGLASLAYTPALAAGTYTIDATFAGNVNYLGAADAAQLTVTKRTTVLVAPDQTIPFGSALTLSATLTSGGSPVAGRTVTFKVGGVVVGSGTTDTAGVATYSYTPSLASGIYTIDADWAGDGFYLGATDAATLTVTKAPTTLVAGDLALIYGQSGSLTATLTESGSGTPISGRSIAFQVNGVAVGTATTNASGVATLAYTANPAAGSYAIRVDFAGDGFYNPASDTATLTVTKAPTTLVAADVTVTYGQATSLSATLTAGATPVSGRTIAFKVNGVALGTATTNASGVATLAWTANLAAGNYPISADFAGDGFYLASTGTATATINQASTTLVAADVTLAYGQAGALTATLTSGGSPVSGKSVQFLVNGTVVGTGMTNASGLASLAWTATLAAGSYPVDASFAGDGFYLAATDGATVTVTKAPTTVVTADVTVPYGSVTTLQATLTSGGNPVAGRSISLSIDGTLVGTGTTDATGKVSLSWTATLAAGTYPLVVDFAGDGYYLSASDTKQVTVTKPATTLTAADVAAVTGSSITLSATLTATAGGAPIGGKSIEFKVNGTVVGTDTTDAAGVASYSYTPALGAGTYTIDATFVADAFYMGATDAATLTMTAAPATIAAVDASGVYNSSVNLTATLTSGGTPVPGKLITFKVNGTTVGTATTDAAGLATLAWTINLAAGTYPIDAIWAGDPFYGPSTDSAHHLTVSAATTSLLTADKTVTYGQSVSLAATLTSGALPVAGKSVSFKVNGTAVGAATTDASGVATLAWSANLAGGTYTITADWAGDGLYLPASDDGTLTLNKAATVTLTNDVTVAYGSATTLTATLQSGGTGLAGRTITFLVNGTAVGTATTNASGVATLTWTANLAAGNWPLVADFAGDSFYLASSATKQATITKPTTTIVADDKAINAFDPVTLSATLSAGGSPLSGKSVEFKVNGTVVGTGTTDAAGLATFTYTPTLAAGTYSIDATFVADAFYLGSTDAASLVVAAVGTTLTADNVYGAYGQTLSLTATLTSTAGGAPISGRLITFQVDGTTVGTATTDASGVATLNWTVNLSQGVYPIDVAFAGDTSYGASSGSATATIDPAFTILTTADVTGTYNQSVSLTATLMAGSSPVAGRSITFRVNGTDVGTATTNAAGVATLPYLINVAAGTYTLQALWSGDLFYDPASDTATLTVNKAATAIVAADKTVGYGATVALTANLTSGGAPLAGKTVEFRVNGALVGTGTTDAAGNASYNYTAALPAGSYPIDATFPGDGAYLTSTDGATLTVSAATTVLLAANVTATYGTTTSLSATLTVGGSPVAGKLISFTVNGTAVGTATTNGSGVATLTGYSVTLPAGTYPILVDWAGDGNYASSSDSKTLTVTKAATVITASDLSVQYGASALLSATLTAGGSPLAGRTVTFKNGATVIGTGTTDAAGVVIFNWAQPFAAGTVRTLTAEFAGDAYYNLATDTLVMTVTKADTTLAPTTGLSVDYNAVINLTALLTRFDNATPISAKPITFKVNGATLAPTQNTNGSGVATYAWTANLAPGNYTFDVTWPGDANYNGASGSTTLTVNKRTRTLNLTATVNPVQYSDRTTLTAMVSPAQSGLTVTFQQGATVIGTATTDSAGVAALTNYQIPWPAGSYPVTASVAGDAFYTAASGNLTLTVSKETVSFSYTGDRAVQGTSYPFLLQSILADGDGSVLDYGAGNVQVRWTISGAGFTTQTHTATVDSTGKAEKTISLQKRAYTIVAEILVNGYIVEQSLAPVSIISAGTGTGLWGTYYEDYDSQSSPFTGMVLSRLDAQVNFNWGASNPETTVFGDSETFSARWTGYIEPMYSESYEFCINANDGIRFWFGGTQRINQWTTRTNAQEFCWTSGALTAGTKYPVTLEYFDQLGNAEVQLRWRTTTTTNQAKAPIPKSQLYPEVTASWKNGEGLTGRYYDSAWNGTHGDNGDGVPELIRNDGSIYYSWDQDPLSPLVRDDQFYVEWKGTYTPSANHSRIFAYSDDGVRVWMRPTGCGCAYTKVLENWNDHSPRWDNSVNNPLGSAFTAGVTYDIWVEFYDHSGQAWIWLATNNNAASVIPQSRFRVELMPVTPTGLAGTAPSSDQVNLTWTANPTNTPQVSGYLIFRSTSAGFTPDQTNLVGSANAPTFTDYNRDPGTTYYYKIAAIDTAGNISGFTAQISVTTP